jgi:hypothetical protein
MAKLRVVFTARPGGISHADAMKEVATALSCPSGRAATVAKETIDRLIQNRHLILGGGMLTLR